MILFVPIEIILKNVKFHYTTQHNMNNQHHAYVVEMTIEMQ